MNSIFYNRNNAPLHLKYTTLALFLCLYVLSLVLVFYYYIQPSLTGNIELRIAADSSTYKYFAELINQTGGLINSDSVPLISLSGNLLGPVILATLLNNNDIAIAIFNVTLFALTYFILVKNISVNKSLLLSLLLINPLMYLSLLCINKEIIGFAVMSLFACYLNNKKNIKFLIISLLLSIMVRWELTFVMILFILLNNNHFIFNNNRILTLIIMIIAITIIYPSLASDVDTILSSENIEGNTIVALTDMQRNYQFFISAIPKMLFNLFGTALSWFSTLYIEKTNIVANIIIGSEICNLLIITVLLLKRKITIRSDYLYFYVFSLLLFSLTPFAQSRYMFPCYVLLCLELCRKRMTPDKIIV